MKKEQEEKTETVYIKYVDGSEEFFDCIDHDWCDDGSIVINVDELTEVIVPIRQIKKITTKIKAEE